MPAGNIFFPVIPPLYVSNCSPAFDLGLVLLAYLRVLLTSLDWENLKWHPVPYSALFQ